MGTITIIIDDEIERTFRRIAATKFKEKALDKAAAEALHAWNKSVDTSLTIRLLDGRVNRGGYTYSQRGEIHARD